MDCGCLSGVGALTKPRRGGQLVLGYWKIRGLAAPFRMLLTYVGAAYDEKRYTDEKAEEWFEKDKKQILAVNALANLPYLKDGSTVVCQTNPIFEYLGDRFGLNGQTFEQRLLNVQALAEIYDLRNAIIDLVYGFMGKVRADNEFVAAMQKHLAKGCVASYTKLENFFKQNGGPYSCGRELRTADFHIFEILDQHEIYGMEYGSGTLLTDSFPMLKAFHEKIRSEPKLRNYFGSDAYLLPCNSPAYSYTKST